MWWRGCVQEALARANVTLPHDVTREELTAFLNAVGKTDLEVSLPYMGLRKLLHRAVQRADWQSNCTCRF